MGTDQWVANLAWTVVAERLAGGARALLPVGAASKEHGPHLPLGTDAIQARYYAARVAAAVDALVWPVIDYGYYPVFTAYPGSISLERDTFESLVSEVLDGIEAAGARSIAILNTGISTIAPLESVIAKRAGSAGVQLVNCYQGHRFETVVRDVERQAFGGHADQIETALMLAIAPHEVDMSQAVAAERAVRRGVFVRDDPAAENYSPSGVNGDPRLATAADGRRLLDALVEDLIEAVRALNHD